VERPRRSRTRNKTRSVKRAKALRQQTPSTSPGQDAAPRFEHLEYLINGEGDITIGRAGPVRCAATAATEDQCLAMLVRRDGETLLQLLTRLDAAIDKALEEQIYVDEVNKGPTSTR
jgi:hypothetical protein